MARVIMSHLLLLLSMITLFAMLHVQATIFVPEEVPSLLSVVYSNLPPIKKGTDSKLGVGFRLGPNADVQFQLELGPQTNTRPIGPSGDVAAAVAKKRHATVTSGGGRPKDWLNNWRLQMSPGYVPDDEQDSASGAIADATGGDVSDTVAHLRQLYRPVAA